MILINRIFFFFLILPKKLTKFNCYNSLQLAQTQPEKNSSKTNNSNMDRIMNKHSLIS